MIKELSLGSTSVIAFRVEGKVKEQDIENAIQLIKPKLNTTSPVSYYVEVPKLDGVEPEAVWEDLKFTLSNFKDVVLDIKRIALVTDKDWLQILTKGAYKVLPDIEQRNFSLEDAEQAKQWVLSA